MHKRDIFTARIFEGLSAEEQLRMLWEQNRRLPTKPLHQCGGASCEETVARGELCDTCRKAKNAAAAKMRYQAKNVMKRKKSQIELPLDPTE